MSRCILRPTVWLAAGALLALPALAQPADTVDDDIPITDPALLERLGFEPDAANVYATPQVYEQLGMSPAERAAAQAATLKARREESRTAADSGDSRGPFGTGTAGYSTVNVGFQPIFDNEYFGGIGLQCMPGATIGGAAFAELQNLPHGAKLEQVDIRYVDNSTEAMEVTAFRICYPDFDDGNLTALVLGVHETTGAADFVRFASIGPLDEDIDLQSCFYGVQVVSPNPCPEDGGLVVAQVRAQWRRQVSPPPATATFGDVPTSHPFFQHIEALAVSGITAGCGGGGDFCPDTPLTRGQMAVFLAKALGLHWGEITQ
ncbi:MAG: S-layer homology domain-containing protein [Thermoanaerobaculia bacterium]